MEDGGETDQCLRAFDPPFRARSIRGGIAHRVLRESITRINGTALEWTIWITDTDISASDTAGFSRANTFANFDEIETRSKSSPILDGTSW